jgi:PPOX class probable F420-dependent enzyme
MSEAVLSERQRKFLGKPRIGRLATIRRDGAPHIAPVWFMFEDGALLVLTDRGSQKHRNIERDPRVEFCVDEEQPPYHTVIVRGRATVEEPRGAAWRLALAVHYLGADGGRRYVETTPAGDEVLLRIQPERVSGW